MTQPTLSTAHVRIVGEILVFPSRQGGDHSHGIAQVAAKLFGAQHGVAEGYTGDCYALPLFTAEGFSLSLLAIQEVVARLVAIAECNPTDRFFVPYLRTDRYTDAEIAGAFPSTLPANLRVPPEWHGFVGGHPGRRPEGVRC